MPIEKRLSRAMSIMGNVIVHRYGSRNDRQFFYYLRLVSTLQQLARDFRNDVMRNFYIKEKKRNFYI